MNKGNPNPRTDHRDVRTGRFASTQFDKMSANPVNSDGPDIDNVVNLDTEGIGGAFPVREPIANSPTFHTDAFGRSTRPNPHRAAVLIDGRTGQRIADFSNDEIDRLLAKREKHMSAAGNDPTLANLFGDPSVDYNGGN